MIRDARSEDQAAIDELSRLAFTELRRIYRPSQAGVARKAALEGALSRIVAVGGRDTIAGTVEYRIEPPSVHLMDLAVHAPIAGRGLRDGRSTISPRKPGVGGSESRVARASW